MFASIFKCRYKKGDFKLRRTEEPLNNMELRSSYKNPTARIVDDHEIRESKSVEVPSD